MSASISPINPINTYSLILMTTNFKYCKGFWGFGVFKISSHQYQ